jgi:dTDP-4-amino-4,6-dideoxygalactose transaminase
MMATVPFYRPDIGEPEIKEVEAAIRSGWLTTGPRVKRFEEEFAAAVGGRHAVALNSCTAALHLAVHALGLQAGQGVLVPTMTFAATAEVVRYEGGIPVLIDCDPVTGNIDLDHAERTIARIREGKGPAGLPADLAIVGIMPVHVAGFMMNMDTLHAFASRHGLWVVEDAAHAFPAAWRRSPEANWQRCGEATARVSCFSFYANKTITTGEGGMAVTDDSELEARIRLLSLHGLSHDAWGRYSGNGSWDYRIMAPGYKYNMTDVAAAIGIHQLARAEEMRVTREAIALQYRQRLAGIEELALPIADGDRIHSWHLFPVRLQLQRLAIDRDQFMRELHQQGGSCSVHWRPLHLHPYYQDTFGWQAEDLPRASCAWPTLVSLPLFSTMRQEEIDHVVNTVTEVCARTSRTLASRAR